MGWCAGESTRTVCPACGEELIANNKTVIFLTVFYIIAFIASFIIFERFVLDKDGGPVGVKYLIFGLISLIVFYPVAFMIYKYLSKYKLLINPDNLILKNRKSAEKKYKNDN